MDQAPAGVTRVINQIVERTVETVVPDTQGASVAMTEKTIVINQDELVPQSIATVQKSVIRIMRNGDNTTIARGVIVNDEGLAVTDKAAFSSIEDRNLEAVLYSGERVRLNVREGNSPNVMWLELVVGTSTGFAPAKLVDASKLTLGQTVLRISGNSIDTVGEGVIAAVANNAAERSTVQASVSSPVPGSVLLTIFGEVIGISTPSLSPNNDTYTIVVPSAASTVTNQSSSS
jgi:hypothetical protein